MLLLLATRAEAFRVDIDSRDFGGVGSPGELITVEVRLDTEGEAGILELGVGVLFDEQIFTYRQDLSSTTTYLLYLFPQDPYLEPGPTCGGAYDSPTAGSGCALHPTRSNQVQVHFVSTGLASQQGVPRAGAGLLASLVFELTDVGIGIFHLDVDPQYGGVFDLESGPGQLTLGPGGTFGAVPESGTGVLVGLGLLGLGVAQRGRRPR
jgi:hypothetical protein